MDSVALDWNTKENDTKNELSDGEWNQHRVQHFLQRLNVARCLATDLMQYAVQLADLGLSNDDDMLELLGSVATFAASIRELADGLASTQQDQKRNSESTTA